MRPVALFILAVTACIFLATSLLLSETLLVTPSLYSHQASLPFPVGVDPKARLIVEQPAIEKIYQSQFAGSSSNSFIARTVIPLVATVSQSQLAAAITRTAVVWPGQRHEEIIKHIGDIARWNDQERQEFSQLITASSPTGMDGTLYPGRYTLHRFVSPKEAAELVQTRFATEVLSHYPEAVSAHVPLPDALIIASLLEREAYDFTDMRVIAGVIWNRLFINMPLQIDATLQYARASEVAEDNWWPVPSPNDKFIDSPYNTYQHNGLPPGPISNPSAEAILAALNPKVTLCYYYFHTNDGTFYCSATYEEHVTKLKQAFGQGS